MAKKVADAYTDRRMKRVTVKCRQVTVSTVHSPAHGHNYTILLTCMRAPTHMPTHTPRHYSHTHTHIHTHTQAVTFSRMVGVCTCIKSGSSRAN